MCYAGCVVGYAASGLNEVPRKLVLLHLHGTS